MPGLLYFLPDRQSVDLAELRRIGLGHAFDRSGFGQGRIDRGPDGGRGVLLAWCDGWEARLGYRPEEQRWRAIPASPAQVGTYRAEPAGPGDLVRPDPLPGDPVTLGDGREWIVPKVRAWRGDEDGAGWAGQLPTVAGLDADGNWTTGEIVERYQALYRRALGYWDVKSGAYRQAAQAAQGSDPAAGPVRRSFTYADAYDAALEILAANYRLGKAEVVLLGLFTSSTALEILDAAIDWATLENWLEHLEKKTPPAPGSGPIGAGSGDSPPDTAPRSPS